jgi:hypothetical protein
MRRVAGPKLVMYGKPKNPTHKYYRCSVVGCPFVMTVEKRKPKEKPKQPQYLKRYHDDWGVEVRMTTGYWK